MKYYADVTNIWNIHPWFHPKRKFDKRGRTKEKGQERKDKRGRTKEKGQERKDKRGRTTKVMKQEIQRAVVYSKERTKP